MDRDICVEKWSCCSGFFLLFCLAFLTVSCKWIIPPTSICINMGLQKARSLLVLIWEIVSLCSVSSISCFCSALDYLAPLRCFKMLQASLVNDSSRWGVSSCSWPSVSLKSPTGFKSSVELGLRYICKNACINEFHFFRLI